MSPAALVLTLAAPPTALLATDLDADGVHELIAASEDASADPPGRVLSRVDYGGEHEQWSLGSRAAWWDVAHGIWLIDGEGLRRLDGPAPRRVASFATPLAHTGPATPTRSRVVFDLDGDGRAELLARAGGELLGFDPEGAPLGALPSPGRGGLDGGVDRGGVRQAVTLSGDPFTAADADGDGLEDIVFIEPERLRVHFTEPGGRLGERSAVWPLPTPLLDPARQRGEGQRYTTDVHLRDLDGDGVMDLLVQRLLSDGTVLGTGAELRVWRGGAGGFGAGQVLEIPGGSDAVYPVDLDGDGDLDLVCPQVELSASNLARGLLDGSVSVSLEAWEMREGRYATAPRTLRSVVVPARDDAAAWSLFADLDGDGLKDLALYRQGEDGAGELDLWRGRAGLGFEQRPWLSAPVTVPVAELLVADLDGDGRGEVVAWAPGSPRIAVWGLEAP